MSELENLLAELTSGDETRAEAAVPGLVAMGEETFSALREMLSSPDTDQRWWAVRTLAQAPQAQTGWLIPLLYDSVPEVRQAAALGLSAHPDEKAIQPLIRALSDTDSLVSSLASSALVAIGKDAVPALLGIPDDASMTARVNAMRALAEIRDPRAIQAMMAALEDESALLQHWAEEGLERLGLNMVYLKPE